MEAPASPPKRITRARAAARSATSGTAASAARATKAANTATKPSTSSTAAPAPRTSVKRKTRSDDHEEDESEAETVAKHPQPVSRTATKATRGPGRPKKNAEPESQPTAGPSRSTRGRPAKKVVIESVKEEAPARATRTRTKKAQANDDENDDDAAPEPEPVKKTRGRPAGTGSKVKKTVTFAEPDKENVPIAAPRSKTAASRSAEASTAGMRAKPVRKPAGAARATRTTTTKKSTKDAESEKAPMPLSPKKVTQLSVNRDRDVESEDELAMDRTPARHFQRNPVKPPVSATKPVSKSQEEKEVVVDDEEHLNVSPTEPTILLGSPIRRPPQSPFKNAMKSPAKRIDGLQLGLPTTKASSESSNSSSFKASLLQSPAKRLPMPMKSVDLNPTGSKDTTSSSPFKQSLFQSPAKRGFSPFKPAKVPEEPNDPRSPAPTPVLLCSPPAVEEAAEVEVIEESIPAVDAEETDEEDAGSPSRCDFNGRMSTLLPRDADPTLTRPNSPAEEQAQEVAQGPSQDDDCETVVLEEEIEEHMEIVENCDDPMILDEHDLQGKEVEPADVSTTPPNSPPRQTLNMFGLRQQDLLIHDNSYSESEDELTQVVTPHSVSPVKHMKGSTMRPRTSGFGFTPLASRFGEWQAGSPQKSKSPLAEKTSEVLQDESRPQASPVNGFFEEEMEARPDEAVNTSVDDTDPLTSTPEIKDPVCEDISITDEDLALAAEANEMSTMSPNQVESMLNLDGNDDSISEASQEYGDENEVPGQNGHDNTQGPPATPKRFIRREFHTVSKVPLKAADVSTPPPQPSLKKRRHSISKVPASRPTHTLSRSATVISYSPTKNKENNVTFEEAVDEENMTERSASLSPPRTPAKSEAGWTNAETPVQTNTKTHAQTPGRDPALLGGAVVFVDVHTMEGADASAIFVELLTQMGARCVKAWNWNPNDEDASAKIGITHVVYKDGGKRTMERVRETKGVVQCVGVGWVLE